MLYLKIKEDIKQAMKDKDSLKLDTLRMAFSACKNKAINEKKEELTDEECLEVLASEAKKRKDSILAYENGNRPDLAEKEKQELAIIQKYLPQQLTEEAIREIVKKIIAQNSGLAFGPVMSKVMAEVKGRAEGKIVTKILKEELSS